MAKYIITSGVVPQVPLTWDPDDRASSAVLSLVNSTANTVRANGVRGNIGISSGKAYLEYAVLMDVRSYVIGVGPLSTYFYYDYPGAVCYSSYDGSKAIDGVSSAYGSSFGGGSVIGVALDMDSNIITFYKNGVSQGPISYNFKKYGTVYPFYSNGSSGTTVSLAINGGRVPFKYPIPSGYVPWGIYRLKESISQMDIGDYISCEYTATSASYGTFANLGKAAKAKIPVTSSPTPDGTFYFIMIGYDSRGRKKLIADRNIQHSISWDTLNTAGVASGSGLPITIDGIEGYTLRLLSGGVSSTDKDNEWDKIIVESDIGGTIVPGDNSVWNWGVNTVASICSTRIGNTLSRGYATAGSRYGTTPTGNATATEGFRPVLLVESKNIYPLILKDNKAYSFSNNAFVEVSSDWNSLTNIEKQALFTSTDFPPISVLKDLINFTILTFSEEDIPTEVAITSIPFKTTLPSAYSPAITAIPKPQFVHASGDIDLSGATNIDWIHINNGIANSVTGNSVLKYVFSTDKGVTWRTYNGSEFVNVLDTANTNDGNIVARRFIPSKAAMTRLLQDGMTKTIFDAAPWNDITLAVNNKLIRFATIFDLASIMDSCYNDNLVYQYDGISVWRQAINGTDYTVRFTSPSKMEVKFLTGGYKAKVNY
jgi:hypothetical protein